MSETIRNSIDNDRDADPDGLPQQDTKTGLAVEIDQIISMIGPISLAGGYFPGLVMLIGWVCFFIVGIFRVVADIGQFNADVLAGAIGSFMFVIAGAALGFGIGSIYAGVIALFASAFVVCLHWSTNGKFHPRWLSQLVGGMTGFWGIAVIGCARQGWDLGTVVATTVIATFAMVVCQHGAATGYRKLHRKYVREAAATDFRFGIRDMMIGTAWVAAFIALFLAIPRVSFVYLACWAVLQPIVFVIGEAVRRHRIRKGGLGDTREEQALEILEQAMTRRRI